LPAARLRLKANFGGLGTLNMASIGISLNNFFFSMNSLRWLHFENYQRRSLAPVR
jgi:N-acetyl-anhydromuramyl-L-alanine amidase AmpD